MAAPSGAQAGYSTAFYSSATAHTGTLAEASATSFAIEGNEVVNTTSMGEIEGAQRSQIDFSPFNSDVQKRILGQRALSEFTFDVLVDLTNPVHTGLRDDDGSTPRGFLISISDEVAGSDVTYAFFNGYVTSAPITVETDGANSMSVTVAQTTDVTWVDAA